MEKISYYIFRIFVSLFRITPFFILYLIADLAYFLFYKVFGYRKKVVRANLLKSFPNKNLNEIISIEKGFYKNLAMIMLESIKGFTMSDKEIAKRYPILNKEVADKYFKEGKNIIALASHYGNWEWGAYGLPALMHSPVTLYKPLTNKYINDYMTARRSSKGTTMVSIEDTRHAFNLETKKPKMVVLVTDQNPANRERAIWVDFLGIETACLHGAEFFTRFHKWPVIYLGLQRVKRGYYELKIIDFGEDLWKLPEGGITELYMNTLEKIIQDKPQDWLWSHKRWKYTRADVQKKKKISEA